MTALAGLSGYLFPSVLGYLFPVPLVLAGVAFGFVVQRWVVLLAPLLLWLVPVIFWVIPFIDHGTGNAFVILALSALYLPIPLAVTLAIGVLLGRAFRRRRRTELGPTG